MIQLFLLISSLSSIVLGQIPSTDKCPNVTVQPYFNASSYLGMWYEYEAYPFFFAIMGKCVSAEYSARPDGKIGVTNRMIHRL